MGRTNILQTFTHVQELWLATLFSVIFFVVLFELISFGSTPVGSNRARTLKLTLVQTGILNIFENCAISSVEGTIINLEERRNVTKRV